MIIFIRLFEYVWLTISFVIFLIENIAWLWRLFKCRNMIYCKNKKCKYRSHCFRYGEGITEEEAQMLLEFLDTL